MPDPRDAYTLALGWLSRRELSARQVRQRLARRSIDEADIDAAVARLTSAGALDDRRMAGAFARTAVRLRARGPARLRAELDARGVSRDDAEAAVGEAFAETGEDRVLAAAIARRWRGSEPPTPAQAARLYRALIRQGFAHDRVRAALRTLGAPDDE